MNCHLSYRLGLNAIVGKDLNGQRFNVLRDKDVTNAHLAEIAGFLARRKREVRAVGSAHRYHACFVINCRDLGGNHHRPAGR